MHYLLFYEVGEDYVSRRQQFRQAHLEKAWNASARGELVLGGALADPVDGAVLLFQGDSPEVAEKFARSDPYVTSGAVKRWHVRAWTTVVGLEATNPVHAIGQSEDPPDTPQAQDRILRMWKARSSAEMAGEYVQYATRKVFPVLRAIQGFRGSYLLRRAVDGAMELMVLTLWDSMAAVRRFAGAHPENAVVEPEAKAMLTSFDEHVTHFEVIEGQDG